MSGPILPGVITPDNLPGVAAVTEQVPVEAPQPPRYRHATCGRSMLAGNYTPQSEFMPCPFCQMEPPQKDFTWE